MKNWSVDEQQLARYPEKYEIWKLEQLINYGLDGQKLKKDLLKKYWSELQIDPWRRKLLALFLNA